MSAEIWELDFYSRPVLDENGKKMWELLVCDRHRTKEFSKFCPPQMVNSEWIAKQLQELVASWGTLPQKIRFYRPAMHNMLNRGCKLADLTPLPSRRLYALPQWLVERMTSVYAQMDNFQAPDPDPLPLSLAPAISEAVKPLPDALRGDRWTFAMLPVAELENAESWDIDFGELFPLPQLDQELGIPGLIIFSSRANPLAGWMSGVDPVSIACVKDQLVLSANAEAQWSLSKIKDMASAQQFEQAKQTALGIHFLAIQSHPEVESFAGFWLLKHR